MDTFEVIEKIKDLAEAAGLKLSPAYFTETLIPDNVTSGQFTIQYPDVNGHDSDTGRQSVSNRALIDMGLSLNLLVIYRSANTNYLSITEKITGTLDRIIKSLLKSSSGELDRIVFLKAGHKQVDDMIFQTISFRASYLMKNF
jgi:hypothetical protein